MKNLYCEQIEFGTPEFDESVRLRNDVLRKPLKLEFSIEDIAQEYDSIHLGCYTTGNNLAGILILKPLDNETVKMRQVAVSPEMQNKGVGKYMVWESEKLVISKGFKKIELNARLEAVPFYEQLGYIKSGSLFKEVGIDHFFMYKNLIN